MGINHVDLFSGIGGFALASKWSGFDTIQFVEKDNFCKKVLNKNFPGIPVHDDIKTFNLDRKVNLMTGGFPCQPFSISGKRKGKDDERYLWGDFYRIIRMSKPNWIIIENVFGLLSMGIEDIIIDLEEESYETEIFVLPACSANAPHRRDRVWIIANIAGKRFANGINNRKEGSIQDNFNGHLPSIYSEWEELKPKSWKVNKVSNWIGFNTKHVRGNNGLSEKLDRDRIKSLGNSIVPQVIFPLMRFIYFYEKGELRSD